VRWRAAERTEGTIFRTTKTMGELMLTTPERVYLLATDEPAEAEQWAGTLQAILDGGVLRTAEDALQVLCSCCACCCCCS